MAYMYEVNAMPTAAFPLRSKHPKAREAYDGWERSIILEKRMFIKLIVAEISFAVSVGIPAPHEPLPPYVYSLIYKLHMVDDAISLGEHVPALNFRRLVL